MLLEGPKEDLPGVQSGGVLNDGSDGSHIPRCAEQHRHQGKPPLLIWGKPHQCAQKDLRKQQITYNYHGIPFYLFYLTPSVFYLQLPGIIWNYLWFTMN